MRTLKLALSVTAVFFLGVPGASADLVLTDNCQEDIRKLQDEISENKEDYTAESRTKANAELTVAKTNIVNPVKCRKNVRDARDALRKGKRDKKERD